MNYEHLNQLQEADAWKNFERRFSINNEQKEKFFVYMDFLIEENRKFDLTNITKPENIIYFHFQDALEVTLLSEYKNSNNIIDVGSGCGMPGLALAIFSPEKKIYLLEVTEKKIQFLKNCIELLKLTNCEVCSLDYKTFIRRFEGDVDLFVSRASLGLDLLSFAYNGISRFRNLPIIYFGTDLCEEKAKELVHNRSNITYKITFYKIKNKKRSFIVLNYKNKE